MALCSGVVGVAARWRYIAHQRPVTQCHMIGARVI